MMSRYVPKTDRVARYQSDLSEEDWPTCERLWRYGHNTLDIARIMGAKEHEIYNLLYRLKFNQRKGNEL